TSCRRSVARYCALPRMVGPACKPPCLWAVVRRRSCARCSNHCWIRLNPGPAPGCARMPRATPIPPFTCSLSESIHRAAAVAARTALCRLLADAREGVGDLFGDRALQFDHHRPLLSLLLKLQQIRLRDVAVAVRIQAGNGVAQ